MPLFCLINLSRAQTLRALADFQALSTSEGTLLRITENVRCCCFGWRPRDLAGLRHAWVRAMVFLQGSVSCEILQIYRVISVGAKNMLR